MEGETPRTLIRGVLQASHSRRSSPRRTQVPSPRPSPTRKESPRLSRSVPRPSHPLISSEKVSVKRPARGSLTSEAKRRRSVTTTGSETITPRTNIRGFLAAAKTPAQPPEPSTSQQRLSRSAISNRQVQKLVASGSRSRRTSPRKSLSQSFPTPSESITPREAMKLYLNAAETVPRSRRSTPRQSTIRNAEASQDESSEEKQEDSESAAADDERSQDEETKPESGAESGEYGDENVQSGVEKGESDNEADESGDEQRAESGHEQRAESGDERAESGDEKPEIDAESQDDEHPEQGAEFHASLPPENNYESSHEATADSSQDEQDAGDPRREQDSSQEILMSAQDEQQMENAANKSRMQSLSQEGESSGHSRSTVEWGKLRTPVLPDTTAVKATPVVLSKPPIHAQQTKPSNKGKAPGKGRNQTTKPKRKASSVLRLPSSLVNGIFGHFSALRVSKDALDAVQVGSDAFFEHIATDLTSYCKHAGRKTIEESDAELLMRRQGLVKSRESFHALIEKYLPVEYRQEIIPVAKSGNKVVPKEKT